MVSFSTLCGINETLYIKLGCYSTHKINGCLVINNLLRMLQKQINIFIPQMKGTHEDTQVMYISF